MAQKPTQLTVRDFVVWKLALEERNGRIDKGGCHAHGFQGAFDVLDGQDPQRYAILPPW